MYNLRKLRKGGNIANSSQLQHWLQKKENLPRQIFTGAKIFNIRVEQVKHVQK